MIETPFRLEYYLDDNGKAPFLGWLYSLRDKVERQKLTGSGKRRNSNGKKNWRLSYRTY